MQINLLYDKLPDQGDFNRSIARARSKKCLIPKTDDFSRYLNWSQDELRRDPRLRYHVSLIKNALAMEERRYLYFTLGGSVETCTLFHDSHIEIEKLGAQQYFTGKCIIVSMDDYLDVAFQKCCGADPAKVRKIRDYETMSYLFMNCALHAANERVYVKRFKGYDRELDNFIDSCCMRRVVEEDVNERDELTVAGDIISKIYATVLESSASILLNCIRVLCDRYDLAIRSQTFSTFVLSPQKPEIEIPEYIDYTDKDISFRLPVLSLKKWQYTDYIRKRKE